MAVRTALWVRVVVCAVLLLGISGPSRAASADRDKVQQFSGAVPQVSQSSRAIDYNVDLSRERFFVHVPANYTGDERFGLIVFISPADEFTQLPFGWEQVLSKRKLLLVAPENAGNGQGTTRRCGLGVVAAMKMMEQYKIDPQRVYAAGFSGGARMAGLLGFLQSDVFHGTVQSCGADFYEKVEQVAPRSADRPEGEYGVSAAVSTPEQREQARKNVRFALITGTKDFRHGEILDIYNGGFAKAGYQAKLLDIAGMEHAVCSAGPLTQAIAFLDGGTQAAAEESAAPKAEWASKPVAQWPMMVLRNEIMLRPNTENTGGTGFLLRLQNGVVVAASARHLIPKETDLAQFNTELISWTMETPARRLALQKLAIDPASGEQLDCILMSVPQRSSWPVEPVLPRETPVEIGETVYLVGYDQDGKQLVQKGRVTAHSGHDQFAYDLGQFNTMGFSGAPILDEAGNGVGIHLGRLTYEDGRVCPYGRDIGAVAAAAIVPTPLPTVAATPAPAAATPMPVRPAPTTRAAVARAKSPEPDPVTKANSALAMAKTLVSMKNYASARTRLSAIVANYPETPAAAEAAKILLEITGL